MKTALTIKSMLIVFQNYLPWYCQWHRLAYDRFCSLKNELKTATSHERQCQSI